jgi:predicted glycogen debranching enzyme
MRMEYGSGILNDFEKASALEWLESNGLGGYASGTVAGALTRRYHGLLIASLEPPVKRTVLLSKLDETVIVPVNQNRAQSDAMLMAEGESEAATSAAAPRRYELGANQYPGVIHPSGFQYLDSFERDVFPVFHFNAGGVRLKKTIAALHDENTTLILYDVLDAPATFTLELLPLASARDHHAVCRANGAIGHQYLFQDDIFRTVNYHGGPELFIKIPGSAFKESPGWYYNFEYLRELERGLEFQEDLFSHGTFSVNLRKGDRLGIVISTEDPGARDAFSLFAGEENRRRALQQQLIAKNPSMLRLMLAADQFIVRRGELHTVIAGYPWFSDWGRDTMIALPGLCLATGRTNIAREILLQFSKFVSEGMLPNRFPDHGELPEYNTFDATLWFFHAAYQYYILTNDLALVKDLLPVFSEIIDWHFRGTRYGIGVDPGDHLLRGGQAGMQLTWMDAKVGAWVVTPRIGKPVEINALWYNALRIMEKFCSMCGDAARSKSFAQLATRVREHFEDAFWNEKEKCLYDYLDDSAHGEIRPNQIYALSLPFPLITGERARSVIDVVRKKLVTPFGLRSLAPDAPEYMGMCVGPPLQRDRAYHQGTVWSHLVGCYIDALYAVSGDAARDEATGMVDSCCAHLDAAGVGSISEIFDGNSPHIPRGCIAQAWSVAELLRVITKYRL